MPIHRFTIRLTSDAEPGTGLGGEVVNELVPRDHARRPILPASHIKGLMRATLRDLADGLGWSDAIESAVFGCADEFRPGVQAAVRLADAVATGTLRTHLVTRTAVEESGVARDQTLRTTEAVPIETEFQGQIETSVVEGSIDDLAWRLALLAISAVGGNRNRGSGRCVVRIEGEGRGPGQILRELAAALQQQAATQPDPSQMAVPASAESPVPARPADFSDQAPRGEGSGFAQPVVLRLLFRACTPICCPEIPDKTNVISTGFSIPASTVQGMVLNRIAGENSSLAAMLFDCPSFRAWPLQPCGLAGDEPIPDPLPTAIRVSLTHRAAKFSTPAGVHPNDFFDEALDAEPYDWTTVADGAPLKASDGVLLREPGGTIRLWKASAMPHVITSHGVHRDPQTESGRNLFTVDAMAPMLWQGLLVMPADAAAYFLATLQQNPQVAVGKSRSVRGSGSLQAAIVEGIPDVWRTHTDHTVLVAQSPLLLPDRPAAGQTAEQELERLASQWAQRHGLPAPNTKAWANVGILFGWNRHRSGLQRACRVALPGSVIAFTGRLDDATLCAALKNDGIGGGRERGFGAVSVHPGKAVGLFEPAPHLRSAAGGTPAGLRDAVQLILDVRHTGQRLPSPSQIRAVQQRLLKAGKQDTLRYLEQQTERTSRIWFTWEKLYAPMHKLLSDYPETVAARALETLADLAILDQRKEDRQ